MSGRTDGERYGTGVTVGVVFKGDLIEWDVRDTLGIWAIGYNLLRVIDLLYVKEVEPEKYSESNLRVPSVDNYMK